MKTAMSTKNATSPTSKKMGKKKKKGAASAAGGAPGRTSQMRNGRNYTKSLSVSDQEYLN